MARASGSYPEGRWFDSTRRYHFFIKEYYGSLAQLGEHLPYKQRVIGSIPITSTNRKTVRTEYAGIAQW